MTLAVIAGQGDLPAALKAARPDAIICGLETHAPSLDADLMFRLETVGSLIAELRARGVTSVCMAGAITRVPIDPALIDAATMPLVPRIAAALQDGGDDSALRIAATLFSDHGIALIGAHEIAPDLLPETGLLAGTDMPEDEAAQAMALLDGLSPFDLGQGCVICGTRILAVEAAFGTDWMLQSLAGQAQGAVFVKAPKQGQNLRLDMPAIGPDTITHAQAAGIRCIVLAARGVMVLNRSATCKAADTAGISLWVRS